MTKLTKAYTLLFGLALMPLFGGCATTVHPKLKYGRLPQDDGLAMVSAGNFSVVTVRDRERNPSQTLCMSPSPDWATALATSHALTASGSAPSGPSASLSASSATTEALTQMAGRTAGVVALRDGLYQACQAYANGQIGRTAYSMILSQYGNLLTAVIDAGGSGSASAAPITTVASPPAVAVSVAGATATPTTAPTGKGDKSGSPAPNYSEKIAIIQQEHIQALVVACLNDWDKSLTDTTPEGHAKEWNGLLTKQLCSDLLAAIVKKTPDLLTPQSQFAPTPVVQSKIRAPKPKPIVHKAKRTLHPVKHS